MERRLAAILAADVVGYSRLMEQDEAGTLATLKQRRREILQPLVAEHRGRIVKVMGDGVLTEFTSAVNAVACAVELQRRMTAANDALADDRRVVLRIGINLGDLVVEGGDLYGDGIIIAVRLQTMAEPGSIYIAGSVHDQVGNKLLLTFEDLGLREIKNIAKPVRVFRAHIESDKRVRRLAEEQSKQAKPSIAVLPFANMSGDLEQEYFSDGLTEDIITALSRVSTLLVIARASTFTYKGQPTNVERVCRELGVRYIMEGSVRRAGERLRVTVQLIDAATGRHVWAERYDRPIDDIFDIQDEITRSVAASTETQVIFAERDAARSRPPGDLKAWELVMQGMSRMHDQSPEAFAEASDFAEEAIDVAPSYPPAHILRARAFLHRMAFGEIPTNDANVNRGLELARAALRLDARNEWAHWLMAVAHGRAGQFDEAVAACERALAINPNAHIAMGDMGIFLATLGRSEEAIEACGLALRLNPRDPANFWRHAGIAAAYFAAANYEAALEEAKKIARWRPDFLRGPLFWAAAAAALGKADEARAAVEHCLAQRRDLRVCDVVPHFVLRFARDEDHERLLSMLAKAGLPK